MATERKLSSRSGSIGQKSATLVNRSGSEWAVLLIRDESISEK
jgi:hypothetical protein